jgi:hypothetical protein
MKYELKIEFKDNEQLKSIISKTYFDDGNNGKLKGKIASLKIEKEDPLFVVFKGLNNATTKILNDDLIDGSMRCVIDEEVEFIQLYPINNYCIIEQEKYSFY